MNYYATYDNNGDYTGFYTLEIHGDNIPTTNIVLTEQQWEKANSVRCKVIDGIHTEVPFTNTEINNKKYAILRSERNNLLKSCDWTQISDAQLSNDKKQEWLTYRQQLRDLPSTVEINNITYPQKPI